MMRRYGSVITRDTQTECMTEAQSYANNPFMSLNDKSLRLVVRKNTVTGRWEAAWEEQR